MAQARAEDLAEDCWRFEMYLNLLVHTQLARLKTTSSLLEDVCGGQAALELDIRELDIVQRSHYCFPT
jgi:hypothetical protein